MSMLKRNIATLIMLVMVMTILFMPENVSAAEKSVTVGDFVVTTINDEGLTEKDYLAEQQKDGYWILQIFTSKPVTVKMRDGVEKTDDVILVSRTNANTANLTLDNVYIRADDYKSALMIENDDSTKFIVNLTLKGTNYFHTKGDGYFGIDAYGCRLNIKGGELHTNADLEYMHADAYFENTKLTFTGKRGSICTASEDALYKGNIKLKNVTMNSLKGGVDAIVAMEGWVSIEDSTIKTIANRGSSGIISDKRLIIKNSNIHIDCSKEGIYVHSGYVNITNSIVTIKTDLDEMSYVGDADEERGINTRNLNVTIKRSKVNVTSESKGDGKYGIYGKKIKIIDSSVNVKSYQRGIKAKKEGLTIDSSNVYVSAKEKAIMVGPKSGISTKKLSLSGCTMKDGRKRGRYNNKYVVVKTKSGNVAKTVSIKMTKPGKPVLTAANVADTGKIKLSWTTTPLDTKYQVYRAVKKDGKYTRIATVEKVKTTKKATYIDKKAKAGKTYYYKVRTIAGEKKSAYSTVKSRTCK